MGNVFARGGLQTGGIGGWKYSRARFEQAMRKYDEIMAYKAAGKPHPLALDLIRGANYYWEEIGVASANGGPDGRGFFDKKAAQDYARAHFGASAYTEKAITPNQESQAPAPPPPPPPADDPADPMNPESEDEPAPAEPAEPLYEGQLGVTTGTNGATIYTHDGETITKELYDKIRADRALAARGTPHSGNSDAMNRVANMSTAGTGSTTGAVPITSADIPQAQATQTQGQSTGRPQPFATTYNPAGPGTAQAQSTQGPQGITTQTRVTGYQQTQNQLNQVNSQQSGYSGNTRWQPFRG
jgi:hypothetical protein